MTPAALLSGPLFHVTPGALFPGSSLMLLLAPYSLVSLLGMTPGALIPSFCPLYDSWRHTSYSLSPMRRAVPYFQVPLLCDSCHPTT